MACFTAATVWAEPDALETGAQSFAFRIMYRQTQQLSFTNATGTVGTVGHKSVTRAMYLSATRRARSGYHFLKLHVERFSSLVGVDRTSKGFKSGDVGWKH